MNQPPFEPGFPVTEPVRPGPVQGGAAATGPAGVAISRANPAAAQARWARVGLLGIGVAAILAAAILAFGSTARPAGTLAAGSGGASANGSTGTVEDLGGGPGGPGGPGVPDGRGGFGLGHGGITITTISGSSISIATDDGWTRTITVDSGTTYTKAGATISLADLAVGDTIGFRQTQESDGTWTIDAIHVILPRVGGQVTAVDGSTITLKQRDGASVKVTVASGAKVMVNGNAATASDIKAGMVLVAEGTKNADGSLDATRVRAGDRGSFRDGPGRGPGFRGGPWGPGDGQSPNASAAPSATGSAS
jgi:hypothetical protein